MRFFSALAILIIVPMATLFLGYCLFLGLTQVFLGIFGTVLATIASLAMILLVVVGLIVMAVVLKPITALLFLIVLGMIDDVIKGRI